MVADRVEVLFTQAMQCGIMTLVLIQIRFKDGTIKELFKGCKLINERLLHALTTANSERRFATGFQTRIRAKEQSLHRLCSVW